MKKSKAIARLRELADRPGMDIRPDQIADRLGEGLQVTVGPFKEFKVRVPGKFAVKVFMAKPLKGLSLVKMLNALDFTTNSNTATKTYSGVRQETNGKITYVTYSSPSGMLVVSTNADTIDI